MFSRIITQLQRHLKLAKSTSAKKQKPHVIDAEPLLNATDAGVVV